MEQPNDRLQARLQKKKEGRRTGWLNQRQRVVKKKVRPSKRGKGRIDVVKTTARAIRGRKLTETKIFGWQPRKNGPSQKGNHQGKKGTIAWEIAGEAGPNRMITI